MPKPKRVTYTDQTPMPWGVHKGIPLRDVPADYMLWLLRQPWIRDRPNIYEYLVANQTALLLETHEDEEPHSRGFDSMEDYEKYR